MSQQVAYFPLGGGLDITTPAIVAKPGTARAAVNYEADMTGYRRMTGYERYSGRTSPTDAYDAASSTVQGAIDREAARVAITTVPGSGPVRGVWYFSGSLYAWRDNAGATAGVMHKATSTGWQQVSAAFPPGGTYEFITYNFIGAQAGVKMYGVNGVGKGFQYDGSTLIFITTTMAPDTPTKVAAHKRHLFFAFPGGSVQHSSIGDPLAWQPITGAAEIAVGDEVTDLVPSAPANLAILAKNSISLLYGNDATDWQLETLTTEAGALPHTAEKMGQIIYMDNRGIRAINTTPAFGNFTVGTMTQLIAPLLRAKLQANQTPVASIRVRTRDTYRVFFADGTGISVYMGKKHPEVMPIDLGVGIYCAVSAETETTTEKIWVGSTNGYVYQLDKGRSFDGAVLNYHMRLPFTHHGSPHTLKRWHRAAVEYDATDLMTLKVAGEVDYADPAEPGMVSQNVSAVGGGGFWDAVNWDQFNWSAPVEGKIEVFIDGVGESMSLLLGGEQSDEEPHILQGLTLFYSVRGPVR